MPQYQGVWNLAQQAQALTRQQWVTDPLFDQTTLLLQGDNVSGSSQNNVFVDSSTNNFLITRNGNTTQGSFSPFAQGPGYWGNYFDGSSLLTVPANNAFVFGTGDFTVELWIYQTAAWNINNIINNVSSGNLSWNIEVSSGNIYFSGWNTTFLNAGPQPSINAWHHIAVCRSGTTLSMFIDGVRTGTTTNSTNFSANNTLSIGGFSGYYYANGYLSNVRLVKGTAVYNPSLSTCAVPTSPLTAISGTSVLTCQNNRFIDNSSNAFAVSVGGGTPSVQAFSPFGPQYQYSPTVTGGSGYFDGTGDYLTYPVSQTPLLFGNSDFTIEAWVYRVSGTGTCSVMNGQSDLTTAGGSSFVLYLSSTATSDVYIGGSGFGVTSPNPTLGQWAHVAMVRTGGTLSTYLNGSRVGTRSDLGTGSVNNGSTANVGAIGGFSNNSNILNGYMSGLRVIKGSGGYNATLATITIPTAPPTAVTNTQLLLNFTNAGILDGTMKNNFETVGNVQVSTSIVKYGSGSLYFDGTGDYLRLPSGVVCLPRSNEDFTVEMWLYKNNAWSTGNQYLLSVSDSSGFELWVTTAAGALRIARSAVVSIIDLPYSGLPVQSWFHFAATRQGNVFRMFVNGILSVSATDSGSFSSTTASQAIGAYAGDGSAGWNGYIDDLRITKGIARYTRNFTPPQVALPRQ